MHEPVLLKEVLEYLRPSPGGTYVDGTVGGGGHARSVLERGGKLIGIDWDGEAVAEASRNLTPFFDMAKVVEANYTAMGEVLAREGIPAADGILLDLGFSSNQIESASRGMSFLRDGPLDMRMSARVGATAAALVNNLDEGELERIFRELGGERRARRIARAIGKARGSRRIARTLELVEVVRDALYPRRKGRAPAWHGRLHPATRVFQALRIAVNGELENLKKFLETFDNYLRRPDAGRGVGGGRIVVISFHSLEDRIVKQTFRRKAKEGAIRILTKKPVRAGADEVRVNPRSRSAMLRAAEKIDPTDFHPAGDRQGGNG